MKTKRLYFLALVLTMSLSMTYYGCKKDKDETETTPTDNNNYTSGSDNAVAGNLFNDVYKQTDDAIKAKESDLYGSKGYQSTSTTYPTINISPADTVTWPKTITIDFGPTNYTCTDGRDRRGVINVVVSSRYRIDGFIATVTFDDYYVEDHKIEGTHVVTNEGYNADTNLVFNVVITNGLVIKPISEGGDTIHWTSDRTRVWLEGDDTPLYILDDVYEVTGTESGTNSEGNAFTVTTLTPLNVAMNCSWIREGSIKIETVNFPDITVDYGNGGCDNNATASVTILGQTYTHPILLK